MTPEAISTGVGHVLFTRTRRPVFKWTQYLPAYDAQFDRYRSGFPLADGGTRPLRVLEIGVLNGGSLQLWHEYFGTDAEIVGIDVNPDCAKFEELGVTVRIGSQADRAFLLSVAKEMGTIDIIIDDGSHIGQDQRVSFETLFPIMSDGGVYAVEDLHTSYWIDYGGSMRGRKSFIGMVKNLIDDMHSWYHPHGQSVPVDAAHSVSQISIYDSVVFIHKASKPKPANFVYTPHLPI